MYFINIIYGIQMYEIIYGDQIKSLDNCMTIFRIDGSNLLTTDSYQYSLKYVFKSFAIYSSIQHALDDTFPMKIISKECGNRLMDNIHQTFHAI